MIFSSAIEHKYTCVKSQPKQ